MNENYIVINGKRAELTEEQIKALGIETEKKRKNPFERVGSNNKYYYTVVSGDVLRRVDINDRTDRRLYNAINYFNDEQFANQVALHQLLYCKLLKFAYENKCEDVEWNAEHTHVVTPLVIRWKRFTTRRGLELKSVAIGDILRCLA